VSIDGKATDLLRRPTQNLVAGHVDGIATVWRVMGAQGAEVIWSSGELGTNGKLVAADDDTVRIVALAPGGFAFAPVDGSAEPIFVPAPAESPRLVGAVAGQNGELWVAMEVAAWEPSQVLRVAADGTVLATHPMGDLDSMVGILRHGSRTLVYGDANDGEAWEKCIPDDGPTAQARAFLGIRVSGAWIEGSQAMLGFDIGGASCATEMDCDPNDDDGMEELVMPMPMQKTGQWTYGSNNADLLMSFEHDWMVEMYAFDLQGADLVGVEGDDSGLAIAVLNDGSGIRVVELSQ
jgi:hypothetical protein